MALRYTTTKKLGETLGILRDVPSWDIAGTPTNENVGTGTGSQAQFFLDQKNIVEDSYTLYANEVAMTDVTHYSLNKTTGEITLTATGITMLGLNALTAKYQYFFGGMSDSYLSDVLERAEKEVDKSVNAVFNDGTVTNPSYTSTIEIQPSNGFYMDRILTYKKPLIDIATTLNGDHTSVVTSIALASGTGSNYPTSGYVIIGSEVISYTGISTDSLTGCTRGSLGTTAASHDDGDAVHSTILFFSDTDEGTAVSWTVQPWDSSMYATSEGLISRFRDSDPNPLVNQDIANRIKIIYYYGYSIIPEDITRLAIIFAKKSLMNDTIGKSIIAGRNEFKPEMMDVDESEMQRIINSYIVLSMGNT